MPLAEAIRRRLFNRRYAYVGRAMLAELAAIYAIPVETAGRLAGRLHLAGGRREPGDGLPSESLSDSDTHPQAA